MSTHLSQQFFISISLFLSPELGLTTSRGTSELLILWLAIYSAVSLSPCTHSLVLPHYLSTVEPLMSGQPPYNGQTVHPLPILFSIYFISNPKEGTTYEQNVHPQSVHYSEVPLYFQTLVYTVYFPHISGQLCSEATWLEKYRAADEESHTVTFELYLSMRDIAGLTQHVRDET